MAKQTLICRDNTSDSKVSLDVVKSSFTDWAPHPECADLQILRCRTRQGVHLTWVRAVDSLICRSEPTADHPRTYRSAVPDLEVFLGAGRRSGADILYDPHVR